MSRLETVIKYVAVVIFIGGFIVYFIGFTTGPEGPGTAGSWMAFILRPMMSSLEMFVSHSDLLEVSPEMKENALYMTFFSFLHFAAIAVTGIIAVYYLGARVISWVKWNWMLLLHKKIYTFSLMLMRLLCTWQRIFVRMIPRVRKISLFCIHAINLMKKAVEKRALPAC
jgi:hypothetical protein